MTQNLTPASFSPQGLALVTPFRDELLQSIEQAYRVFGIGTVSAQLEVCLCDVCMSEATREEIIATPNRALSGVLLCEYSNSAHGTVLNTDDLLCLLPRYLELLADEVSVDPMEKPEVLWRIGVARHDPGFLTLPQSAALDGWAMAMARHFAWADAMGLDPITNLKTVLGVMIAGGWPAGFILSVLDTCLSDADTGAMSTAQLAASVVDFGRGGAFKLDYIFTTGIAPGVVVAVEDWLLSDRFRAFLDAAHSAKLRPDWAGHVRTALKQQTALRAGLILPVSSP